MSEILGIVLDSMRADSARVEQIATNLANGLTAGYKRGIISQAAASASFTAHLQDAAQAQQAGEAAPPSVTLHHDARPGTLKATGSALDFAIAGPGWFEVETPEGLAYTRRGNFTLDAAGRIVTTQGHPVMGLGGAISLPGTKPTVTAAGVMSAGSGSQAEPIAQLRVMSLDSGSRMEAVGDGLYRASAGMKPMAAADIQVRQGFLENANVSTADEMTQLIRTMRHFEAMQKMAQGYDEMLGAAIRKLGDAP